MSEPTLVLCTIDDQEKGRDLARTLVEEGLAACVNLLPGIESIYRWQGKVERDSEVLLLIKTHRSHYPELEKRLVELHPYDTPEVLALDIPAGSPAYLTWLGEQLRAP